MLSLPGEIIAGDFVRCNRRCKCLKGDPPSTSHLAATKPVEARLTFDSTGVLVMLVMLVLNVSVNVSS